jgi:hypothetical protein
MELCGKGSAIRLWSTRGSFDWGAVGVEGLGFRSDVGRGMGAEVEAFHD